MSKSTVPKISPKYRPSRFSTTIWVLYALVVATAISGPAQVYSTSRFLASRRAAMESSVSPDWLMTMTRSPLPTMGSL